VTLVRRSAFLSSAKFSESHKRQASALPFVAQEGHSSLIPLLMSYTNIRRSVKGV